MVYLLYFLIPIVLLLAWGANGRPEAPAWESRS